MTAGYQIAQVAHAVADFASHRTEEFRNWHETSQYIVALQCEDAKNLEKLFQQAKTHNFDVIDFKEPDLNNEITSIVFSPNKKNRRFLANLPLAGIKTGKRNKHFQKTIEN